MYYHIIYCIYNQWYYAHMLKIWFDETCEAVCKLLIKNYPFSTALEKSKCGCSGCPKCYI